MGTLWNKVVGTLWELLAKLWEPWEPYGAKLWEPCRNLAGTLQEPWEPCGNLVGTLREPWNLVGTLWEPGGMSLGAAPACSEAFTMAEDPKAFCCWGKDSVR